MKKNEFNAALREHAIKEISPQEPQRKFVTRIYNSFEELLGKSNTLQIGSYPRFTAIRPLHDLDILLTLGDWNEAEAWQKCPLSQLKEVKDCIDKNYKSPYSDLQFQVSLQTHSVTIVFKKNEEEIFNVDIVAAFAHGLNEFSLPMYMVPEIVNLQQKNRSQKYSELRFSEKTMNWIPSDPRGYIEAASKLNKENPDFRLTVKIVKAWKNNCGEDFPLKSFHLEQIITGAFLRNDYEIFDAVFDFFISLPKFIENPQIKDRADNSKFIDQYVSDINNTEKAMIKEARDYVLCGLENFQSGDSVADLISGKRYKRLPSEQFLFDFGIQTLTEPEKTIEITSTVLEAPGGFRPFELNKNGQVEEGRKINFQSRARNLSPSLIKWKVKNDNSSPEQRGEISDWQPLNNPEKTAYHGKHFVECYAILDDICIAKSRQDVTIIP